jgi:hypothetical protein
MKDKTLKHTILLPAVVATVAIFSLAAVFPAVVAQDTENLSQLLGDNETLADSSSINMTSSTTLVMDNGTLDCQAIATEQRLHRSRFMSWATLRCLKPK